jgi:hypothetical protein
MSEPFIPKALEMNRLSLALGTALQFETTMRQREVIGEWAPVPVGDEPSGIILNGRRWVNGLTWSGPADGLEVQHQDGCCRRS